MTTSEEGSTMDYQEAVAAAAGALRQGDDANWELARLTHERTRTGAGLGEQPGKVGMEQWCADVRKRSGRRFSVDTGHLFKQAWRWYLENSGVSREFPAFNEVLARLRPGSRDSATVQARVDAAAVEKHLTEAAPEDKAATLARLLADPAVLALAVPYGSPLSRALADAIDTQRALREERVERIVSSDPVSGEQRSATSVTRLVGVLSRFAEDVEERLRYIRGLPDASTDPAAHGVFLREAFLRAESALASVKALLTTGRAGGDVDQFVRGVLAEEER